MSLEKYLKTVENWKSLRNNLYDFSFDLEEKIEELQFQLEHLDETGLCHEAVEHYQKVFYNSLMDDLTRIINDIRTVYLEYLDRIIDLSTPDVFYEK